MVLLMPSDHVVADQESFHKSVMLAARAAQQGFLVTFGIKPSAPETGYGYIKGGAALAGLAGVLEVGSFVEKPDRDTAQRYLESGDHFWNSGMFMFKARAFLDEVAQLQPKILDCCRNALAHSHRDMDFCSAGRARLCRVPV